MGWYPCCCDEVPTEECGICAGDTGPADWIVEIGAWPDDQCTDCDTLEGEWVIPFVSATSTTCLWQRDIFDEVGELSGWRTGDCLSIKGGLSNGYARIDVAVQIVAGVYRISVTVLWGRTGVSNYQETHIFVEEFGATKPDCLEEHEIPFSARSLSGLGDYACAAISSVTVRPAT